MEDSDNKKTTALARLKKLSPKAERALRESELRRQNARALELPQEFQGRDGPEPVRYGDWECKGIASDF